MEQEGFRVYRFRWMLLGLLIPVIVASEVCWLTFAPVSSAVQALYGVDAMRVDLFSISYMAMYVLFVVPASWVIDKYGFKVSAAIGAALTALFALGRFVFAGSYALVLVSQFLLAAGQPFLVNISTKVPANWFPVKERSTAAGLLIMAQYIGFIVPMVVSPLFLDRANALTPSGMQSMLGAYAAFALAAGVLVLFTREKPPVAPGPEAPREMMTLGNVRKLLGNVGYLRVLIVSFVSMGLFNTLMTTMESILSPKGFSSADAGIVMAVFVVAGIVGAVAVPFLSDKTGKRVPLFVVGVALIGPLCLAMLLFGAMPPLFVAAMAMGFTVMGLAPVLFQHGAEVAYPVPEGTSFGFIMLAGQISGVVFVVIFDQLLQLTPSAAAPMLFLVLLALIQTPVTFKMKESEVFRRAGGGKAGD